MRNAYFHFSILNNIKYIICGHVRKFVMLSIIFWTITFDSKFYGRILGIPVGSNCAPLVTDLFLFCYKRNFMLSLSDINQADVVEAFNSISRYLDDLLNIDNPHFEHISHLSSVKNICGYFPCTPFLRQIT